MLGMGLYHFVFCCCRMFCLGIGLMLGAFGIGLLTCVSVCGWVGIDIMARVRTCLSCSSYLYQPSSY